MSAIRWTNHPDNPLLNGTIQDVEQVEAKLRAILKQAVFEPRANYGTPQWAEQRRARDANRKAYAGDTAVTPLAVGFGVVKRQKAGRDFYYIQECLTGGETRLWQGIPPNCPETIVKQLQELNGMNADTPEAIEARRVAQCEIENKRREGQAAEKNGLSRFFGK